MYKLADHSESVWMVIANSVRLYKSLVFRLLPFTVICSFIQIAPNLFLHYKETTTLVHMSILSSLSMLISLFFIAGAIYYAYHFMTGKQVGYSESFSKAFRSYPVYLITFLVYSFLSITGLLFFVVPGIFMQILFDFFLILIMIENCDVITSLKKSAQLVFGNWWRTFFVFFCSVLLIMAIIVIIETMIHFPVVYMGRAALSEITWINHASLFLFSLLCLPWILSVMLCQYYDLKLRQNEKIR